MEVKKNPGDLLVHDGKRIHQLEHGDALADLSPRNALRDRQDLQPVSRKSNQHYLDCLQGQSTRIDSRNDGSTTHDRAIQESCDKISLVPFEIVGINCRREICAV